MIADDLARLAADPSRVTPNPAEVTALADQIAAAIARLGRISGHVTWAKTQVRAQRGHPHPEGY